MRKNIFLILCAVCIALISLASCSKDGIKSSFTENDLLGKWKFELTNEDGNIFEFKENGKLLVYEYHGDKTFGGSITYKWSIINGNQLGGDYFTDEEGRTLIKSCTKTKLVLILEMHNVNTNMTLIKVN